MIMAIQHEVEVKPCGCQGVAEDMEPVCGRFIWLCSCGEVSKESEDFTDWFDAIENAKRHQEKDKSLEELVSEYVPARMAADAMAVVGTFEPDHMAAMNQTVENAFQALFRWHIRYFNHGVKDEA